VDYVWYSPGFTLKTKEDCPMTTHNFIKVIKRSEREPPGLEVADGGAELEASARGKARETAATVREWVSEFRQGRPARDREIRKQLGWPEIEREGRKQPTARAVREGED
jgi:hypothetical protein